MSKMSNVHANQDAGDMMDDCDWDAPEPAAVKLAVRDRVKVYLPSGNYCRGWVESVEGKKIGVRLVNGNYRSCRIQDVSRDAPNTASDPWGDENR